MSEMNEKTKKKIKEAVKEFIIKDRQYLIYKNVYEVTISHRIGVYLEKKFPNRDVDCEYNKNLEDPKRNTKGEKIRPDIIIHKRGENDNLVIIEVKKAGKDNKKGKKDIKKLKDAVSGSLNYALGVYIGVLKRKVYLCWIEKGKEESCEVLSNA